MDARGHGSYNNRRTCKGAPSASTGATSSWPSTAFPAKFPAILPAEAHTVKALYLEP